MKIFFQKYLPAFLSILLLVAIVGIVVFNFSTETVKADAAFRSSNSTTYATRTNTTVTAPSGIQNGDLLIIFFSIGGVSPPTPTPPAGFTVLTGFPVTYTDTGVTFTVKTYAWYKIASGESGNYTVTHTSANTQGYMMAVSGADTVNPFQVNPTTNTGYGSLSTALGITTLSNNNLIIYLGSDWNDVSGNLSPPTGTTPTFTERQDPGTVAGPLYVADGVLNYVGSTGDKSQTNDNTGGINSGWMASLIAIKSANTNAASAHVNLRGSGANSQLKIRGGSSAVSTPGAITRTGSVGVIQSSANSGSQNITVPADATLIVVGVMGYVMSFDNYFGTATLTLGGQSLTLGRADLDAASGDRTAVFYLASASLPTGTQTLAWDWGGTQIFSDGGQIIYAFYKGVDTGNPKKTDGGAFVEGGGNTTTITTASMTASSGDLIWSVAYLWNSTVPTGQTWTNATSIYAATYNSSRGAAAETFPSANTSISLAPVGGSGSVLYTTLSSVVFRASTASSPGTGGNVKFR